MYLNIDLVNNFFGYDTKSTGNKNKNKQAGLHKTKKILHSKGNHPQWDTTSPRIPGVPQEATLGPGPTHQWVSNHHTRQGLAVKQARVHTTYQCPIDTGQTTHRWPTGT